MLLSAPSNTMGSSSLKPPTAFVSCLKRASSIVPAACSFRSWQTARPLSVSIDIASLSSHQSRLRRFENRVRVREKESDH